MTLKFDGTVIVPVADPDDGARTTGSLVPYLTSTSTVVVVNVIEKAGGGIDKAPMGQREEYAEEIFERARESLEGSPATVETDTLYGTDVVETIFDAAREEDADAVVFNPREGNRLMELLTGNVARRMIKEASVPVVALPRTTSE
ncbi:universal stress protein [Natrarchaeobius chitinivorans]|uniref:Universal stress protein n=1 Tax=Natrarchaeobius chitinivorans TaxID=1679083 RepID=A0A3N6LSY0_NATCH|nr:universal stress protein [Natrarchaeobius chitinivorans]RQG90464.1 universal stress protein [Natrarchaeobius chitinivorans]